MPILTLMELIDIVIMTAVLGYIFMDVLRKPFSPEDYIKLRRFDWKSFKFACLATAPAIILHEFGHKLFALSFGLEATFNAAYFWLGLALLLKLSKFPFIFFVPAYISIFGDASSFQYSLIAFAGPLVNLLLWLGSYIILKTMRIKHKYIPLLALTSRINMFLFIFNMLPIPGFDGFKVFSELLSIF